MNEAKQLFLTGAHSLLVEQIWDRADHDVKLDNLPFLIGSLSFLGRAEEAEILFERHHIHLTDSQRAPSLFFLIMGLGRAGELSKAYSLIRQLSRLRHQDAPLRFWFYQALAFLRFLHCRFQKALDLMNKAQRDAVASQDFYARALASDLKGHAQIAVGEVFLGLKSLEQAHRYFRELGNAGHARTIARALVTYRAKHSIDPLESLAGLEHLLRELEREENNFSLAGTYLEIARIYSLTGQLKSAEETLERAAEVIHRDGLESYSLMLDFRRAYMLLLQGQAQKALGIIRNLKPSPSDLRSQTQVLGLLHAVESVLEVGRSDHLGATRRKMLHKSEYRLSQRIESRLEVRRMQSWGKDPLGDLLDDIHDPQFSTEEKLERIEKNGYWSFAYEVLHIPRSQCCLVLNALPGLILIFDRGQVGAHKVQLNSQMVKLFQILGQGETTREELVAGLWGYSYNPLRHDSLIYGLMSRVRSLLGEAEVYLVSNESGSYSLRRDFQVIQWRGAWQEKKSSMPRQGAQHNPDTKSAMLDVALNQRQRKILRYLEQNKELDLNHCLSLFEGVSKVTLSRDLSQLVERKLLLRLGRARSTSYILSSEHQSLEEKKP